jgi:hypothetical protein
MQSSRWYRTFAFVVMFLSLVFPILGQTTHKAVLSWVDTLNPSGTTYTILRATGLCSGTPAFSTLASGVTTTTYTDSTVTPGNFCYQVEATVGGVLSAPSNSVVGAVPAFPPTQLTVTVQ